MPYAWTDPAPKDKLAELRLWPHRSLPQRGFAGVILITFGLLMLPLISVLGTPVMWGLLPFVLGVLWLLWYALRRSYRDGALTEELSLWPGKVVLTRENPRGPSQSWDGNPYWVSVELHEKGGPVEQYLTLKGSGRVVEIGAFLSPEERTGLRDEIERALARAAGYSG
ncbi:DUF2244 domain-containing protein [Anianabacter salinae]|uniref:DUF2244 domain-containing protein n=1 Tax=Anianabacter salinae TaxID=2851023 RepID=UPI00225E0460|nr:DUF2244 domain-containing protein [Anianabacter salinae]MBV0912477.1 DUF2244 domain-containing protein [Anianabacter salinae]